MENRGLGTMTKLHKILRTAGATGALFALAGSALADGYGGSIKDAPPAAEGRTFSYSVNAALTSDYIFRGISNSSEHAAVSAGLDLSYGILYAGFWGSSIDFDGGQPDAGIETDIYAGIKPVLGPVTFDFGVLGYLYPGSDSDADYLELKAGASITPFTNASLGAVVYWSPEFPLNTGEAVAVEGTAAYTFAAIGRFTPSISGTIGYQQVDKSDFGNGPSQDDDYVYWNVGAGVAFDKWSVDVRYWDTDIDTGVKSFDTLADERVVGTIKVVLP